MPLFLEKLLEQTRFSTVAVSPAFLPRKVGLGYALSAVRAQKSILAPVRRAAREAKREEAVRASESSEEVSKLSHISKKRRR